MEQPKFITLHGIRFCRDEDAGYYRNGTLQKLAHRHVWEVERGPIPEGWHVHHIDRDRGNNDIANLLCLSAEDHQQLHIDEDQTFERRQQRARWFAKNVTPKAVDWHQSEVGRAWHREHARRTLVSAWEQVDQRCSVCHTDFRAIKREGPRFCSSKCRAKWRRMQGVDNVTRSCAYCGGQFIVNRYKPTKYCGGSCSNAAHPRLPRLRA
jgi:hypothetical protein